MTSQQLKVVTEKDLTCLQSNHLHKKPGCSFFNVRFSHVCIVKIFLPLDRSLPRLKGNDYGTRRKLALPGRFLDQDIFVHFSSLPREYQRGGSSVLQSGDRAKDSVGIRHWSH